MDPQNVRVFNKEEFASKYDFLLVLTFTGNLIALSLRDLSLDVFPVKKRIILSEAFNVIFELALFTKIEWQTGKLSEKGSIQSATVPR